MFERFTERARHVVVLSQDEARSLKHNYIGTEHLLAALLIEGQGLAWRSLVELGLDLEVVRREIVTWVGLGDETPSGQIPFEPGCKQVLELALRESLSLGHGYVSTEHILLGMVRQNDGIGVQILAGAGLTADDVRRSVYAKLGTRAQPLTVIQRLERIESQLGIR